MIKKLTAVLTALVLVLSLHAPAFAETGAIYDGRWLDADNQGFVTKDTPVSLKDDFGLYVNKEWILQAKIPGLVNKLSPTAESLLTVMDRKIALMKNDSLTGHDAELVQKYYQLVTDRDYRNKLGVAPIMPCMEAVSAIGSLDALYDFLFSKDNLFHTLPVIVNVDADLLNPDVYIAGLSQPALMMGGRGGVYRRTHSFGRLLLCGGPGDESLRSEPSGVRRGRSGYNFRQRLPRRKADRVAPAPPQSETQTGLPSEHSQLLHPRGTGGTGGRLPDPQAA